MIFKWLSCRFDDAFALYQDAAKRGDGYTADEAQYDTLKERFQESPGSIILLGQVHTTVAGKTIIQKPITHSLLLKPLVLIIESRMHDNHFIMSWWPVTSLEDIFYHSVCEDTWSDRKEPNMNL